MKNFIEAISFAIRRKSRYPDEPAYLMYDDLYGFMVFANPNQNKSFELIYTF